MSDDTPQQPQPGWQPQPPFGRKAVVLGLAGVAVGLALGFGAGYLVGDAGDPKIKTVEKAVVLDPIMVTPQSCRDALDSADEVIHNTIPDLLGEWSHSLDAVNAQDTQAMQTSFTAVDGLLDHATDITSDYDDAAIECETS